MTTGLRPGASTLATLASLATATLMLCGAALYNGFPLVWYDSTSHIADAILGQQIWARTATYSLFLAAFHRRVSLWPPIVAQAAIAAYLLRVTMRVALGAAGPLPYLSVVAALALGSSLPWFAGQLMPDVFTGLAVLGLFALGFGGDRLSPVERPVVFALTSLAVAMHLSHLPLALALLVAMPVLARVTAERAGAGRSIAVSAGAVVVAASAILALNVAYAGRVGLAPYGPVVVLSRLLDDGPAVAYLRGHCADGRYRLCAYLDELPLDSTTFLWRPESPLARIGGVDAVREEASAIVLGTLRARPLSCLRVFVDNTLSQLGRFETAWRYGPYRDEPGSSSSVSFAIRRFFPGSVRAYASARQNAGALSLDGLRRLHRGVVYASLAVNALFLAWAARRRPASTAPDPPWVRRLVTLVLLVAVAIVANAFVTGALSQPVDRYGSRVAWLLVLSALLVVAAPLCSRGRGGSTPDA